eukprot:8619555-Lingulodinium_polyedra.AAC.1
MLECSGASNSPPGMAPKEASQPNFFRDVRSTNFRTTAWTSPRKSAWPDPHSRTCRHLGPPS